MHIDINQTLTGGVKGTTELRTLDWSERPHEDHLFGKVVGQSRYTPLAAIEDAFLAANWDAASISEQGMVESFVVNNEIGWTANQVSRVSSPPNCAG